MTTAPADPFCDSAPLVLEGRNQTLGRIESTKQAALAYYSFGVVLNAICFAIWVMEKHKYERTRVRPTLFVWMAVSCSLAEMSCGPLQSFTNELYPCWLGVVLLMLIIPFGATSIFGRYMLFNFLSRFAQSAADVQTKLLDNDNQSNVASSAPGRTGLCSRIAAVTRLVFSPNQKATSEEELADLKMLSSRAGILGMAFILCLPYVVFVIVILSTDPVLTRCHNCAYSALTFNLLIATASTEIVIAMAFWFSARRNRAEDRWGLKSESFYSLLFVTFAFASFLASIFDPGALRLQPYTHMILMTIGIWLMVLQQSLVQIYLARRAVLAASASSKSSSSWSSWFDPRLFYVFWTANTYPQAPKGGHAANRKVEDLASSRASQPSKVHADELEEILQSKPLSDLFEKHLIGEFGVESLFFLRQVQEWKKQYYDITPKARVARARRIVKGYVMTSGLYSVNLSSVMLERIQRKVFGAEAIAAAGRTSAADIEDGASIDDVPVDLFDEAIKEIRNLLQTGAVARFKRSAKYTKFMEDVKGSPRISSAAVVSASSQF